MDNKKYILYSIFVELLKEKENKHRDEVVLRNTSHNFFWLLFMLHGTQILKNGLQIVWHFARIQLQGQQPVLQ